MMHTWFRPSDDFLVGGVVNGVRAYDPWHRPSDLDMIKSEEVDVADSDDDAHKSVVAGMTATPSRDKLTEEERVKIAIAAATVEYKKQLDDMERKYRVKLSELETNQRTKLEGDVSAERERVTNKFKEEKERLLNEFKQRLDETRTESARTAEELNRLKESNKEFYQRVRSDMESKTAEIARLNDAMSSLNTEKTSLENHIAELELQAANGWKTASEARTERDALQKQLKDVNNRLSKETASGQRLREELETTQRAGEDLVNSLKRELADAQDAAQTAYNRDIGRLLKELTTLHVKKTNSEEGAKATINNMIKEKEEEIAELNAAHERILGEQQTRYETTIRQIEERNREASDQAAALETELRDEIGRLGESSHSMQHTIETMIERHAKETTITTSEINRLKDKLTTIEAEKQSLKEHIDQMNDQSLSNAYDGSEMERTLAVLRGKIAESDKHRELLYKNEQALLSQTAELQEKLSEVKSELEARVSAHKAEVRSVLDSQTLTLQQKEKEMERLREDKDALSRQHADVTSELEKARAEYNDLRSELGASREEHAAELKRVREEAEEQTRTANGALETLQQKHDMLSSVKEGLESELGQLQRQLETSSAETATRIAEKIQDVEEAKNIIQTRDRQLDEQGRLLREAMERQRQSDDTIVRIQNEKQAMEAKEEDMIKKNNELNKQTEDLTRKIKDNKNKMDGVKKRMRELLQTRNDESSTRITKISQEKQQIEQEYNTLKELHEKLRGQNDNLQTQLQKAGKEQDTLLRDLEKYKIAAHAIIEAESQELDTSRDRIKALERGLETARKDLRLVCKTIKEKRSCNPYKTPRLNRTIRFLPNSRSLTIPQPRSSPWPQRECRNGSSNGSKKTNMQK
eukprot:jgi/Mesvir1/9547/Mv08971-RA.1